MYKTLVLGDIHVPYESKSAVALAKKVAASWKPDLIVSIGDLVDCYSISDYPRNPARVSKLKYEVEAGAKLIKELRKLGGEFKLTAGNHEWRYERYLATRAPELFGLVAMRELLGLERNEWYEYRDILKVGRCHYSHEVGFGGVGAAAKSLAAFQGLLVFGHTHKPEIVYGSSLRGESHACMNVGWLGDPKAIDYASKPRVRSWQHGVGLVTQDDGGRVWMQFIPFINNRCVVDGKEIKL